MISAFSGSLLVVGLCWGGLVSSVQAQCLSLDQLVSISAAPTALAKPEDLAELPITDWSFKGVIPRSHDVYWAGLQPIGGVQASTITLRTQQNNFDVVLKTAQANCVRQVRSALRALRLAPVNVTCPNGCEAQRYDGPDYQATIYSKMKGDYPFVVVLHPLQQAPQALPSTPEPVRNRP